MLITFVPTHPLALQCLICLSSLIPLASQVKSNLEKKTNKNFWMVRSWWFLLLGGVFFILTYTCKFHQKLTVTDVTHVELLKLLLIQPAVWSFSPLFYQLWTVKSTETWYWRQEWRRSETAVTKPLAEIGAQHPAPTGQRFLISTCTFHYMRMPKWAKMGRVPPPNGKLWIRHCKHFEITLQTEFNFVIRLFCVHSELGSFG